MRLRTVLFLSLLSLSFLSHGAVTVALSMCGLSNPIRVPADCPTIQAAVDAASPGATIIVSPGTYDESVLIQKPLVLQGVDRNTTIVQTSRPLSAFNITTTQNVLVTDFTVTVVSNLINAIEITSSSNVTILNSTITGGVYAVFIQGGTSNRVENSLIQLNDIGVGIWTSVNNNVTGNVIMENGDIGLEIGGGSGHLLKDNKIQGSLVAVEISSSTSNLLQNNLISAGMDGLDIRARSNSNGIIKNQLSKFTDIAITIEDSDSNQVLENLISDNISPTPRLALGVKLQNATGNMFARNNLVRNGNLTKGDSHLLAICSQAGPGCRQSDMTANNWNDTIGGNFWDNYVDSGGLDTTGDGIGDTILPFPCPSGGPPCSLSGPPGVDYKPLMAPWQPPTLLAFIHASTKSGLAPLQVVFTSSASGGQNPYSYRWNFGDSSSSTAQNATHTFTKGAFVTTLSVIDGAGSQATTNSTVDVKPRTTSTTAACSPSSLHTGDSATCTVTVMDTSSGTAAFTPTGVVSFTSSGTGTFSTASCNLSGSGSSASCQVTYTPTRVGNGTHVVIWTYAGDAVHSGGGSQNTARILVSSAQDSSLAYIAGGLALAAIAIVGLAFYVRRIRKSAVKPPVQGPGSRRNLPKSRTRTN